MPEVRIARHGPSAAGRSAKAPYRAIRPGSCVQVKSPAPSSVAFSLRNGGRQRGREMKRTLLVIPFLGLSAFGGYYHHWNSEYVARIDEIAREPLAIYNYRDGRTDAEADLAQGKRRLFVHGSPPPDQREYSGLLEQIYRVKVESITLNPTLEVKRYAAAYNAIMEQDLAATFGPETLATTRALAQRRHALKERIDAYVSPL